MKQKIFLVLGAASIGYLLSQQLRGYQPFKTAYLKSASLVS